MKNSNLLFLVLLTFSPVIIFLIHMVVGRVHLIFKANSSPLSGVIWSVGIGFLAIGFIVWQLYLSSVQGCLKILWMCIYGTIVFSGFAISYFILFAMTEAARRIKIMRDLYQHGEIMLDDLENLYGAKGMLSARLERMIALGQLKQSGIRYQASGKLFYLIGKVIMFWSWLLKF